MSDLIERLRHCGKNARDEYLHELTGRAADRIEELEREERHNVHDMLLYQKQRDEYKAQLDAVAATIKSYDDHSATYEERMVVNAFRAILDQKDAQQV